VRTVCDKLLDCTHRLDYTSLDVREGLVGAFGADLGEHEVFEVPQKPLAAYAFYVGWRINVNGNVGQMFV
jgi:hypothetical protein